MFQAALLPENTRKFFTLKEQVGTLEQMNITAISMG